MYFKDLFMNNTRPLTRSNVELHLERCLDDLDKPAVDGRTSATEHMGFSKTTTQELQSPTLGDFQPRRTTRIRAHRTAWAHVS